LTTFLLWEKMLPFSEQKKTTLDYIQNPIRQYKLASIPTVEERPTDTFHNRNFFTTAHSGGKNERNVDKWKQQGSVPGRTVCEGVRNMALLQDDIILVTTICKCDGISGT